MNLGQARKQLEQKRDAVRQLEAEYRAIVAESTEARLEKNRREAIRARNELYDAQRELNSLVKQTPRPKRVDEITDELRDLKHQEQAYFADVRGLPTKYIRTDAVEHFGGMIEAAKREAAKLRGKFAKLGPNVKPGGRIVEQLSELDATVGEWDRTKRTCEIGAKVASIRERVAELNEEKRQIEEQHREAVLAG